MTVLKYMVWGVLMWCGSIYAQAQHRIQGRVRNGAGNPISMVQVRMQNTDGKMLGYATTDVRGIYNIKTHTTDSLVVLLFSHLSYNSLSDTVRITLKNHDVTLTDRSQSIREVTVKAAKISQRGDTLSYRLSAFAGKDDYTLKEAMKRLPGIEVEESGRIKYLGKEVSKFYIDDMDMLGSRYNLATENIPAEYVTTVQVMDNHQAVQADQKRHSDDVAINIKLDKRAKMRPVGSYEASIGMGKDFLYQISGGAMLFMKDYQLMGTVKMNNVSEISKTDAAAIYEQEEKPLAVNILGELTTSPLPIRRSLYIDSHDLLSSLSFYRKTGTKSFLKGVATYTHTNHYQEYLSKMLFNDGTSQQAIRQSYAPQSKASIPSMTFTFQENGKQRYIDNTLLFTGRFEEVGIPTEVNMTDKLTQREKIGYIHLKNNFSFIFNHGRFRYSFLSHTQLLNTPGVTLDIISNDAIPIRQQVSGLTFVNKETFSVGFQSGYFMLLAPLTLSYRKDRLDTYQYATERYAQNKVNGDEVKLSLVPQVEYGHPQKLFFFRASLGLNGTFVDFNNAMETWASKRMLHLSVSPFFTFSYVPDAYSTIRIQGLYDNQLGDAGDMLTADIINNSTMISRGTGILANNRLLQLTANYHYKLPLTMWFANLGGLYTLRHSNLLRAQTISGDSVLSSRILSPNRSEIISGNCSLTKQFDLFSLKVSIGVNYTVNKSMLMQDNGLYHFINHSTGLWGSLFAKPAQWLELSYRYTLAQNKVTSSQTAKSMLSQQSHNATLKCYPFKGFVIGMNIDANRRDIAEGVSKQFTLADMELSYKRKALKFSLNINNLFNLQRYEYTLFNAINTYYYSSELKGRQILFSTTLTL